MGCDGGTIPRRDELVRVQKKPEQVRVEDYTMVLEKINNIEFSLSRKIKMPSWCSGGATVR